MDALEALQKRVSVPRLAGEVPAQSILNQIFRAGLRVPDHAQLKPFRFLLISGQGREVLGEVFVAAQRKTNPLSETAVLDKVRAKPLRAPLVIVVIARITPHPKVPEVEQFLSAGACAQNMLVAAHAQGVGAMWRTGGMAYHPLVRQHLGLDLTEHIVGFLYMGKPAGNVRSAPELDPADYFKVWPEKH